MPPPKILVDKFEVIDVNKLIVQALRIPKNSDLIAGLANVMSGCRVEVAIILEYKSDQLGGYHLGAFRSSSQFDRRHDSIGFRGGFLQVIERRTWDTVQVVVNIDFDVLIKILLWIFWTILRLPDGHLDNL